MIDLDEQKSRDSSSRDSTGSEDLDIDPDILHELPEDWAAGELMSDEDLDMIDLLSAALDQVTHQLREKKNELQHKTTDWTSKTRETVRTLKGRRDLLQKRLLKQYQIIIERMNRDTKTVQLRDKIAFVVGVGNTCITPVLVSRTPDWIPLFYSIQSFYLLTLRLVVYKSRQWHYFIFDLCYFVNVMTLLFVWSFWGSSSLFIATFGLTNGPVAWAIVTWRNSLVFHSLDKVTSVFIHIFPALVTYVIRWMPTLHHDSEAMKVYRNERFPALAELDHISFRDCIIYPTVAYLIWQALYFVFIMVRRREKVESGSRMTSYSWLLDDTHGRKGFIQHASFAFGPKYKIYMFMFLQLIYNVVTTLPIFFVYQSFLLHTVFLIVMFSASVWNGAGYYIEVFSRRYVHELEQQTAKVPEDKDKMQ